MGKGQNILVLTYWSYKEALIQTYTLPYLSIIKKQLPPESKIYLVTLEQRALKMSKAELKANREQLLRQGIVLVPLSHRKWSLEAVLFGIVYLIKLFFLIFF